MHACRSIGFRKVILDKVILDEEDKKTKSHFTNVSYPFLHPSSIYKYTQIRLPKVLIYFRLFGTMMMSNSMNYVYVRYEYVY